ncbi:MAG TPA: DUF4386 domain-containing protein [Saprospiraceae bacterium]|nr:DUF4386 domain-containing protein [Saprospiraceae bacterium]
MEKTAVVRNLRIIYPIWIVLGIFSLMYVPSQTVVPGDGQATVNAIGDRLLLYKLGIAGTLLTQLLFIAAVVLLHRLFSGIDRRLRTWLLVLGLTGVPIAMLNSIHLFAALTFIQGEWIAEYFATEQVWAWVLFFLELNEQGIIIASIFWGLWLFPLGALVLKSGYFPRFLGWLVLLAGVGYMLNSFIRIMAPEYSLLSNTLEYFTFGEVIFALWLIILGVNKKTLKDENPHDPMRQVANG